MRLYRGCIFIFFVMVIGIFSLFFSRSFGLLGLILPGLIVAFIYVLIENIVAELYYLSGGEGG
jgi:hypothetical protein